MVPCTLVPYSLPILKKVKCQLYVKCIVSYICRLKLRFFLFCVCYDLKVVNCFYPLNIYDRMLNIQNYGSSSEDDGDDNSEDRKQYSNEALLTHLKPVDPNLSLAKKMEICAAPVVTPTVPIYSYILSCC